MDSPGGMVRHHKVRKLAGKGELGGQLFAPTQLWASLYKDGSGDKVNLIFKRQLWPALSWLRRFHEHNADDLVRHLYLVDGQLDGMVLEVDASTIGEGGAACWFGERRFWQQGSPGAFVTALWNEEGVPAHQATWEAFMGLSV